MLKRLDGTKPKRPFRYSSYTEKILAGPGVILKASYDLVRTGGANDQQDIGAIFQRPSDDDGTSRAEIPAGAQNSRHRRECVSRRKAS